MLGKLDSEIRDTETRIARERNMLAGSLQDTGHRVRTSVASPQALTAFAVAGFILGELTRNRREREQDTTKTLRSSLVGLLVSGAMALIKARYGSPWHLAAEVMGHARGRRADASRATPAGPPPDHDGEGATFAAQYAARPIDPQTVRYH
jgi:hypothetical protein